MSNPNFPPGYAASYYGPQRPPYAGNVVYGGPMPPQQGPRFARPPPAINTSMNMNLNAARGMAMTPPMRIPGPQMGLLPRPQMQMQMRMMAPPRPAPGNMYVPYAARTPSPQANSNQWQWNSGKGMATSVAATAAPVHLQFNARGPSQYPQARPPASASHQPEPVASKPAPSTTPDMNSTKWPPALQDYVKRAFARCKGQADQALTQKALKEMITNAIMTSTLWTKNWTVEPLPTLVGDVRPNIGGNGPNGNVVSSTAPQSSPYARPPPPRPYMMMQPSTPTEQFISFSHSKPSKRKQEQALAMNDDELKRKNQRRQRFLREQREAGVRITPTVDTKNLRVLKSDGELDFEAMTIKGTCQTIEKEYLRLTSPPHPSTVRPQRVLEQALDMVKQKWKKGKCDYIYACSQLKSIRQDCTVQRIKNAFTVIVYETHARVALESGDINEFNQCQTQLHELYEKAIPGQAIEFLSYRILYCVYVSLQARKADSNVGLLDMYNVLSCVTSALREHPAVRHALDVREAVAMNDYLRFFRLYGDAPNMSANLMDPMLPTVRLRALRTICKAFRPHISIDYVRQELHLEGEDGDKFVAQSGIVFVKGSANALVDTKNSDIVWVLSDSSSLI